ncbi:DUF6497 family protein [Sedimentitalea arenosa]|uniref:DUF6497 family protein n=1 Tax=Sedimentitalea arenosa TaxID=2798803 RepID=UPI001D0BAB6B|nr:DUF6497 family protein [Arenibacterium arenosum]
MKIGRGTKAARAFPVLLLLGWPSWTAAQQVVPVPSGQHVELTEVLLDDTPGETWARFRFVAPQIARDGGDISYETAIADMDALCRGLILPYLEEYDLDPRRIVISLSDRDVPFGAADPDATQFFEAYRPNAADCIWEEF